MDMIHVAEDDGSVEQIFPLNNFSMTFRGAEICKYRILFTRAAEDFDKIKIKVTK